MPRNAPPTRTLRNRSDLDQLKRQAKELLDAFRAGHPEAAKEVHANYRQADASTFALHDAQLVMARAHGFDSWPKLKAFVDGITVRRLVEAVRNGDLDTVRSMVTARPELVHLDVAENDEHRVLHHAVLQRRREIVRFLMQHGADARKGIWPHRAATTAFTLSVERGDDEVVRIIEEEENRRSASAPLRALPRPVAAALMDAFRRGDQDAMIATLETHPELVRAADVTGRTALHWAAACLWPQLTAWLLDRGADPTARANNGATPLDAVGDEPELWPPADRPRLMKSIAGMLLGRGAGSTARAAIATGDAAWLRARHADGMLANGNGLVSHAVAADRPDMLALLLDLGLDPDESGRVGGLEDVVPTWGEPLRACAISAKVTMAEILLAHGANANTNVYAASCAMFEAYKRRDESMIALLERHGGRLTAVAVAELGLVEHTARLLAEDAEGRTPDVIAWPGSSVAQDLLWGAIECPSPEIVMLALRATDWPRDDPRWHGILENGLYLRPDSDRSRHLDAFRLVLDRCDPNVRSGRGTTVIHEVAASRGGLTASDRVAYTTLLLDCGARLDIRDDLLQSTPLGWACRWGRVEMVKLLLERGADPLETDAEPWATPAAWARKTGHPEIAVLLETFHSL
jgi:ankyrin repeat protein